jgi:hypothetical protein
MTITIKYCRHSLCEKKDSRHFHENICCQSCERFRICDDHCADEDGYCSDERRAWRNVFIGIAIAAVLITGYILIFTACEWRNLTANETAIGQAQPQAETITATPVAVAGVGAGVQAAPVKEETADTTKKDIRMLARLVYGEAGGIPSVTERAAVVWCVLNRVDDPKYPATIADVIKQPHQFSGYKASHPATAENIAIVRDVLMRWEDEKSGIEISGRILPADYIYFTGDGERNHFEAEWHSGVYWDWSLPNPYED